MDKVTADFYAVLVPDIWSWGGEPRVRGIRCDRIRASKPALKKGEIAVRVKLNFDKRSLVDAIPVTEADVFAFSTPEPALEVVGT